MTPKNTCDGYTAKGKRCKQPKLKEQEYCRHHIRYALNAAGPPDSPLSRKQRRKEKHAKDKRRNSHVASKHGDSWVDSDDSDSQAESDDESYQAEFGSSDSDPGPSSRKSNSREARSSNLQRHPKRKVQVSPPEDPDVEMVLTKRKIIKPKSRHVHFNEFVRGSPPRQKRRGESYDKPRWSDESSSEDTLSDEDSDENFRSDSGSSGEYSSGREDGSSEGSSGIEDGGSRAEREPWDEARYRRDPYGYRPRIPRGDIFGFANGYHWCLTGDPETGLKTQSWARIEGKTATRGWTMVSFNPLPTKTRNERLPNPPRRYYALKDNVIPNDATVLPRLKMGTRQQIKLYGTGGRTVSGANPIGAGYTLDSEGDPPKFTMTPQRNAFRYLVYPAHLNFGRYGKFAEVPEKERNRPLSSETWFSLSDCTARAGSNIMGICKGLWERAGQSPPVKPESKAKRQETQWAGQLIAETRGLPPRVLRSAYRNEPVLDNEVTALYKTLVGMAPTASVPRNMIKGKVLGEIEEGSDLEITELDSEDEDRRSRGGSKSAGRGTRRSKSVPDEESGSEDQDRRSRGGSKSKNRRSKSVEDEETGRGWRGGSKPTDRGTRRSKSVPEESGSESGSEESSSEDQDRRSRGGSKSKNRRSKSVEDEESGRRWRGGSKSTERGTRRSKSVPDEESGSEDQDRRSRGGSKSKNRRGKSVEDEETDWRRRGGSKPTDRWTPRSMSAPGEESGSEDQDRRSRGGSKSKNRRGKSVEDEETDWRWRGGSKSTDRGTPRSKSNSRSWEYFEARTGSRKGSPATVEDYDEATDRVITGTSRSASKSRSPGASTETKSHKKSGEKGKFRAIMANGKSVWIH